jgi:hypothetical protein
MVDEEVREWVKKKFHGGRMGSEEMAVMMALMSNQNFALDPQSFLLGALMAPSIPRSAMTALALSSWMNPNAATTGGATSASPMGNMLPLFFLTSMFGDEKEDEDKVFQFVEKAPARTAK